jgi:hypothetical protein
MMIRLFIRLLFATALLIPVFGVAHAKPFDDMELTIRVMESESHGVRDLVNEIELPKGNMKHDKDGDKNDRRGGHSADRDHDEEHRGDRDDDREEYEDNKDEYTDSSDDHYEDSDDGKEDSKSDD